MGQDFLRGVLVKVKLLGGSRSSTLGNFWREGARRAFLSSRGYPLPSPAADVPSKKSGIGFAQMLVKMENLASETGSAPIRLRVGGATAVRDERPGVFHQLRHRARPLAVAQ
jgi:hypothetical protein